MTSAREIPRREPRRPPDKVTRRPAAGWGVTPRVVRIDGCLGGCCHCNRPQSLFALGRLQKQAGWGSPLQPCFFRIPNPSLEQLSRVTTSRTPRLALLHIQTPVFGEVQTRTGLPPPARRGHAFDRNKSKPRRGEAKPGRRGRTGGRAQLRGVGDNRPAGMAGRGGGDGGKGAAAPHG